MASKCKYHGAAGNESGAGAGSGPGECGRRGVLQNSNLGGAGGGGEMAKETELEKTGRVRC